MVSPNSTLPNDEKEAQDSAYNPGEQSYKEGMGAGYTGAGIDQLESFANDPANHDSAGDVRDAEDRGGNWQNNTSSAAEKKESVSKKATKLTVRTVLKKRGPLGLIALLGLGGGLAGTALFSPGLILVQMKEALVNRFDTQLASMDARTTKLIGSKMGGVTSGVCGSKLTIRCKFKTVDVKQAAKLKAAGIDIEGDTVGDGTRINPKSVTVNGKSYSPSEFASSTDPDVKVARLKAFNPKYAGFSDPIATTEYEKLGITKERALPDGDDDAKTKAIDDEVQNGEKINIADDGVTCDSDGNNCVNKDKQPLTDEEQAARKAAIQASEDVVEEGAEEAAATAIGGAAKGAINTAGNFIKVTGVADITCQAFSAVRGLGYAAKTVRAIQLARYAMIFVNTADQIKAGTAKPEDVAYLGTILTSLAVDASTGAKRKAAMDSAGMDYTFYGGVSGFKAKSADGSYVSQFMAGGGLTGDLISVTDWINNSFKVLGYADPVTDCATLQSTWVQLGSVAAGIALMFVPGVDVGVGAADAVKAAAGAAVSVMLSVLPELLKGIVAGNVTKGAIGEDSGNAIASGFGVIASGMAQKGANAPMSVDDAVQYTALNDSVLADYTSDEAKTLSPFDPSNKDTFVGSIVNKLLPFVSATGSISNPFVAFGSLASTSLASVLPSASAASTEDTQTAYSTCNDPDYVSMGVATDPFCNLVLGIPTQYLNRDPVAVADALAGQYDEYTGEPVAGSQYDSIVKNCINRDDPYGSTGADGSGNPGTANTVNNTQCKVDGSNVNDYLFYMDQRVDSDLSGLDDGSSGSSTDTNSSSTDSTQSTDSTTTTPAASGTSQSVIMNSLTAFNAPSATSTPNSVSLNTIPQTKTSLAYMPRVNIGWYWSAA